MEDERPGGDTSQPKPTPPRIYKPAISWDCMDCIVIEDEESIDIRDRGENADKYWRDGWIVTLCNILRRDFDSDERGRYHRVYPTRYSVDEFEVTRSMRRVIAKNRDLKVVTRPLRITPAKEDLYLAHHLSRFGHEPRELLNKQYQYIVHHPARLMETCYFLGKTLIAFSIFEDGDYSLWSNTAIWAPAQARRCMGTLSILREIEYARARGHVWYYMGYYWPGNHAYEYKARFRPLNLYDWDNKDWVPFQAERAAVMLNEPLRRRKD